MAQPRFSKVGRKTLVCISLIFLLSMLLMVCTKQLKRVSSYNEESARHLRSLSDNDTLFNNDILSCTQELVPANGTVEAILKKVNVTNDYVSLVRFSINFIDGDLPDDSEQSNPTIWHWGLGGRGRTFLHFPYDNQSLSFNTLNYGVHWVPITFDNRFSQNDSYSDSCLGYSLSKLLQQVRLRITNTAGVSDDIKDDVLCKERYLDSPSFRGTLIPGYSLFDLQASTYYECWNIMNVKTCEKENCLVYPSYNIYCTLVNAAFGITYVLLFLALIYELWRIYSKAYNYQDEDIGDKVNILQISLIPPVLLMLAWNKARYHKRFYITYWALVYAIPFIIYFVAFLWYVTRVQEYAYRSYQRGGMFSQTNVWGLDFTLANFLYIDGAVVFLYFMHKYRLQNQGQAIEEPYDWKSKKGRLLWYTAVVVLCFFRFSAAAMLLVEIVVLTVIGIAINIKYGSPIWVNAILGAFVLVANIVQFFDSYQHLFSKIYSVGTKVDREGNFPNKVFEQTDDGSPQLQFKIESRLLRNIIRKWLPLQGHLFNTTMHILVGFAFLAVVAGIVVFIDQTTQVTSFVEYVITAVPLVFAAAGKLGGSSLTAGGKAKNRSQDKLLKLEADLREYAETGKFPQPGACCWQSFSKWASWCLCCAEEDQQDPDEGQTRDQATGAHVGSVNQSSDLPQGSATGQATPPATPPASSHK